MQPNTMKALYPKRELPGSDSNPRFAQTETHLIAGLQLMNVIIRRFVYTCIYNKKLSYR